MDNFGVDICDEKKTQPQLKDESNISTKVEGKSKWYKIDAYMLPAKFAYYFQLSKDFSYQPFMLLFLSGVGLTNAEAGLITGVRLFGLIIGSPIWGYITDCFQNHRIVTIFLCFISILLFCSQPFISKQFSTYARINTCSYDKATDAQKYLSTSEYKSKLFFTMLSLNIAASAFDGCTMSMVDAGVVRRINANPMLIDFGWNRLFGGFGFASGSLISGVVINNFPAINVTCYSAIFVVYLVCTVGLAISFFFLFRGKNMVDKRNKNKNNNEKNNRLISLMITLKKLDVALFFVTVFLVGVQQSTFVSFTAVTLRDLNASSVIQGLTVSLGGLSCVVSIAFSTKLIKLCRGTWNTIIICAFSYVIRYLLFAFVKNPVLAIPISLLQSLGLGLFIAAAVHHVKTISPEGLNTTMYGIMNAMHFGAGFIFANVVGGQVFQRYGSKVLFVSAAILIGAWCILLIVYRFYVISKDKNQPALKF